MDVPIPAHMCLPIDELQRRAEEMEYSELLDQVIYFNNKQFHHQCCTCEALTHLLLDPS